MKMGNTRSPWRYDVALNNALRSPNIRATRLCFYEDQVRSGSIWSMVAGQEK
jgi:hypothetical protein